MKAYIKVLISLALSFMFCFMCIGYAAVSNELFITGSVTASPPEGIQIVKIVPVDYSATPTSQEFLFPTNVDSTIYGATNSYVTYEITVLNNTPYTYAYAGLSYDSSLAGYNGNSYINRTNGLKIVTKDNIDDTSATFNSSDVLYPGETRVFYATYTIGRNVRNTNVSTFINYKFGVNIASVGEYALDSVLQRFGDILNDTSEGGAYETLTERIDDKYENADWQANFIGNVAGAIGVGEIGKADTETLEELFQDKLQLVIDGTETNVTLIIKREDVDGNENTGDDYTAKNGRYTTSGTGCEMTLYMTTADLSRTGSSVTVYAAVFTCDKNADGTLGEWYMIGDKYLGTATVVGYVGNTSTQNSGSFDTGTWRSSRSTYKVSDDYSYSVTSGATIQTITQAKDNNATTKLRTLINQATGLLNGDYGNYAGEAMVDLETALNNVSRVYTVGENGNITLNSNLTRSQVIPVIKELEVALSPFENILGY